MKKKERRLFETSGNIYFMLKMRPPSLQKNIWTENEKRWHGFNRLNELSSGFETLAYYIYISDVLDVWHYDLSNIWPSGFVDKRYFLSMFTID